MLGSKARTRKALRSGGLSVLRVLRSSLRGRSTEIHWYLGHFRFVDVAVDSLELLDVVHERAHQSLGVLGRKEHAGLHLRFGHTGHHANEVHDELRVAVRDDRQVLATGQLFTQEDGGIDITFPAKGKPGGDPDLMYRFEITVIVTDITGETHEATKSLVLNQQGYEINISLRERISIQSLKSIEVTATNSDGADVKVNGEVEISAIKGPAQNRRNRLWAVPDISLQDNSPCFFGSVLTEYSFTCTAKIK